MASRDAIVRYLDDELESAAYRDYGPNGLQVVGADEVSKVCAAVSASLEVFERAAAGGAQLLLVHHGLFWDGASQRIGALERRRLEALFRNDISLVAYHLPLDGHAELGNNAQLAGILGVVAPAAFAEHRGRLLGRYGSLAAPATAATLAARLGGVLGSAPLVLPGGPEPIETVGVVSGAAARDIRDAAALRLHCFVTGEPEEDAPYLARELGVTLIAAGHNATETVGVRAAATRIGDVFQIEAEFLPVANPV